MFLSCFPAPFLSNQHSRCASTAPPLCAHSLRFEWFVLCFELVALCHAAHTLSSSPLSSFPTRRSATLALLSCVTAVSIILTNAKSVWHARKPQPGKVLTAISLSRQ